MRYRLSRWLNRAANRSPTLNPSGREKDRYDHTSVHKIHVLYKSPCTVIGNMSIELISENFLIRPVVIITTDPVVPKIAALAPL